MMHSISRFFLLAFLLNFVWESWHAVWLYQGFDEPGRFVVASFRAFVAMMTRVALTDAVLLLGIVVVGHLLWCDRTWLTTLTRPKVWYLIGAAVVVALTIELKALYLWQQWSYTDLMPTVVTVGVSPLVQLALTGLAAWWLMIPLTSSKVAPA